ncbi:hypothetical protein E8E12_003732 [Didymella heteroderae]|uniref:Uncharacterized protein n=1 Tax=Didymella heteroderae TaxID=1769908 RepID=A0A9P5BZW8_9PLEO|nr:hypothetical protein E8E12_003732 [Didymella heteroderae]
MNPTNDNKELFDIGEQFLVDPVSLNQDEAQYVLAVAKLVLRHARNLQQTIDILELDCSMFVAMYQAKDDWFAQLTVNGMVAKYIAIYENLANRLSMIMSPGPDELPELQNWLSSQSALTEPRKLRNLCAHNTNVKQPLKGTIPNWSVFTAAGIFDSVKTEMPRLIDELSELVADLEKDMSRFSTPLSTPPDSLHAIYEMHAHELLTDKNEDFLFNDLHQRMLEAFRLSGAIDLFLDRVHSQELDLQQQNAYECVTKFTIIKDELHSKAYRTRQERNERAAEVVEA